MSPSSPKKIMVILILIVTKSNIYYLSSGISVIMSPRQLTAIMAFHLHEFEAGREHDTIASIELPDVMRLYNTAWVELIEKSKNHHSER